MRRQPRKFHAPRWVIRVHHEFYTMYERGSLHNGYHTLVKIRQLVNMMQATRFHAGYSAGLADVIKQELHWSTTSHGQKKWADLHWKLLKNRMEPMDMLELMLMVEELHNDLELYRLRGPIE